MHPGWTFIMIFSTAMLAISFYEGPKLLRKIDSKSTRIYALISIIGIWGALLLLAVEKAGFYFN
ncbi:MAG TPA: hypothetical protein PLP75_01055 [Burkholderiales bacterium]|nr:hypothetical protein [Burkholderiales bacterium]